MYVKWLINHLAQIISLFAKDYFGESTDYNHQFIQDFFFKVNHYWLERYPVDRFRYDCALQHIENHQHSCFLCNFATTGCEDVLLQESNCDLWYKLQHRWR